MNFDEIKNGRTYYLLEKNNITGHRSRTDYGRTYKLDILLDDDGKSHKLFKMIFTRDASGNPIYYSVTYELLPNFTYEFTEPDELLEPDVEAPDKRDYWYDTQYVISVVLEDEITKIDDAFKAIEQGGIV